MAETRIRICLQTGEVEIEGAPDFLAKYDDVIDTLLTRLKSGESVTVAAPKTGGSGPPAAAVPPTREFGEVLHSLPGHATGTDQILVAGWFVQASAGDAAFSTGEANKLLVGQGVKLSNAAQAMRGNLGAKRVFKVPGNRWRVSKQGEEYLRSLIKDM